MAVGEEAQPVVGDAHLLVSLGVEQAEGGAGESQGGAELVRAVAGQLQGCEVVQVS